MAEPTEPMTTPTISTTMFVPISALVLKTNSLCRGYQICSAVTAPMATADPSSPWMNPSVM